MTFAREYVNARDAAVLQPFITNGVARSKAITLPGL